MEKSGRRASLILLIIGGLEMGVYFYSASLGIESISTYQLAARYSARISFFLILALLMQTGFLGLQTIFKTANNRKLFKSLFLAFSINHLIHFYFLFQNVTAQGENPFQWINLPQIIAYIALTVTPILLWNKTELNTKAYWLLNGLLFTLSLFCLITFVRRLSNPMPFATSDLFYQISVGVIGVLWVLNIRQVVQESKAMA